MLFSQPATFSLLKHTVKYLKNVIKHVKRAFSAKRFSVLMEETQGSVHSITSSVQEMPKEGYLKPTALFSAAKPYFSP